MTYDCFTYNGEEMMLDLRMKILDPYVDYFVICESEETFSGNPKPIYYNGNNPKVIHLIKKNPTGDSFQRAGAQKDHILAALDLGLGTVRKAGVYPLKSDDIIYFGDVDEIWKPQTITDDKIYNLKQLNYCYYLNNRSSEEWIGTIVGKWGSMTRLDQLTYSRAHHENVIEDGGWHFTNMGGADMIRRKLESYDHQEFNHEDIKADLERKMEAGEDYVGRNVDWQGNPFVFHTSELDLPQFILDNKEKYADFLK